MKYLMLSILMLTSAMMVAQKPFNPKDYLHENSFKERLGNYIGNCELKTYTRKIDYTLVRFPEISPAYGFNPTEMMTVRPFEIYFTPDGLDNVYLVAKGKCRGMHISVPVVHRGVYYAVIDPLRKPSLLIINSMDRDTEIFYHKNCAKLAVAHPIEIGEHILYFGSNEVQVDVYFNQKNEQNCTDYVHLKSFKKVGIIPFHLTTFGTYDFMIQAKSCVLQVSVTYLPDSISRSVSIIKDCEHLQQINQIRESKINKL
ncbi:MAG: hypothetical protein NXI23_16950 [Bacteroidetes bacterium]|nr:hypothetical protein [Bacteroidota bacterium]